MILLIKNCDALNAPIIGDKKKQRVLSKVEKNEKKSKKKMFMKVEKNEILLVVISLIQGSISNKFSVK